MANVNITIDAKPSTVTAGRFSQPALVKMTTPTTNAVPRLNIPALNQKFSAGDNVTINGGEIITSSLN
jgi:chitodextrinase